MRGIGTPLLPVAALACAVGALLLPSGASAQINIEGMIRGAMGAPCCYGGYRHRSTHHAAKHKDDDSTSSSGPEKDATQEENTKSSSGSGSHQQASTPAPDVPRSAESDAPARPASGGGGDDLTFAPAR